MRRKDIDWLRIFGVFLLFPFHAARIFDPREDNYIHSDAVIPAGVAFMDIIWPWFMPLMFLVAGIAAWYSLQKCSALFARAGFTAFHPVGFGYHLNRSDTRLYGTIAAGDLKRRIYQLPVYSILYRLFGHFRISRYFHSGAFVVHIVFICFFLRAVTAVYVYTKNKEEKRSRSFGTSL